MREINVAVIGCGARSTIAGHVNARVDARVTALVDHDPLSSTRLAENLGSGAPRFLDHRELIGSDVDVDAALVLTPDDTHAEIAIDLLEAGISVYLEKPLATTVRDADAVLAAAQRTGGRLYVGHNMRHMAVVRTMRDLIAGGAIGVVKAVWCRHFVGNGGDYYFKDWHAERSRSTGLLLQKGAHDIDVIHWLAGGYTTRVAAMGGLSLYGQIEARRDNSDRSLPDWFDLGNWPPLAQRDLNPIVDVEDLSMMLMQLDNGAFASYQQCHYTPDYWRNYTVIGTAGRLENFGDGDGGVVRVWNTRTTWKPEGDIEVPIEEDADGHDDADIRSIAEFLRFVRTGAATDTSPVAARNAVATAVAATESIRDASSPRDVPQLDDDAIAYFAGSHGAAAAVESGRHGNS